MTEPFEPAEPDPLRQRLRAADPARSVAPPPAHWIDRLTEATMSHDTQTRPAATRRRTWLVPAAAAAALAVVGVGALVLGPGDDAGPVAAPTPTTATSSSTVGTSPSALPFLELTAGNATAGRCLPVSATTLAGFPVAFDGYVADLDGSTARLRVTRWFVGGTEQERGAGSVLVTGMSRELQQLVAGVDLEVGGRYLITASADGDVTACGLSAVYGPRLERLYAEAFGG